MAGRGMKTKPMLFSGPMVRAILDGRKTQTRRVLNPQPSVARNAGAFYRPHPTTAPREWYCLLGEHIHNIQKIPYAPGDRLWVREAWAQYPIEINPEPCDAWYKASDRHPPTTERPNHWRPSIHMPRWASRLTLEVTDVRVQRVQEISDVDVVAEGVEVPGNKIIDRFDVTRTAGGDLFRPLWDSLNAKRGYGWEVNPWVVALTFKVHRCNVDRLTP